MIKLRYKKSKDGKHFADTKKRTKHRKIKLGLYPLFLIISIIITAVCIIYIYNWEKDRKHSEKIMNVIKDVSSENIGEKIDDKKINFEGLKNINKDVVGWIKVNNTNIDYPVVKGNDNNFYLNHSFDKEYSAHGWPFIDYEAKLDGTDKNITIYGHNIKDGSMFGSLKNILNSDWYENEENLIVNYTTEKENQKYKVFSIYRIEKETYYTNNYFKNEKEYKDFLNQLKTRSIVDFKEEVNEKDTILTLSTCADNNKYRVVLHAKKIE